MDSKTQRDPARPPLDGHRRAELARWVEEHWDAVFGLAYRMAASRQDAEDLTQETFLRAGERRDAFSDGTNVRSWLMRIATNLFLDARRRRSAMPESAADEPESPGPAPGAGLHNRELGDALEAALKELPDTARAVFLLRTREDLSFAEIAEAIGSTEQTARWHMLQARRRLMRQLDGWLG